MCFEKESSESNIMLRLRAEKTERIEITLGIDKTVLLANCSVQLQIIQLLLQAQVRHYASIFLMLA